MNKAIAVVLALTGLGAAAAVAPADRLPGSEQGGRPLTAALTGAAEVPGPGDPEGSGAARITLNSGQRQVCWALSATGIQLPASGAHIHRGTSGVAGPIVVHLTPPDADGTAGGCTQVSRKLIDEIRHDPAAFYVNVHTSEFPGGAIRGQLQK